MKPWTLILFSLFINFKVEACRFTDEVEKVYSLSGPMTTALKELKLLNNPKLLGVSIFHPITPKEMSGKFIPGGIFLSPKLIQEMNASIVFYDESQELGKVFKDNKIQSEEIKTRSLMPYEVTALVIQKLQRFVTGCEREIQTYKIKTSELEQKLLIRLNSTPWAVFFLGEYVREKLPDLLMVNDGVVKWLREKNKIKTYPSDLAYVSWSARILNTLPQETKYYLLKDSGSKMDKKVVQNSAQIISLVYPGALIPGINQLEAFEYLFSEINR